MDFEDVRIGDYLVDKFGNEYEVAYLDAFYEKRPICVRLVSLGTSGPRRTYYHNFLKDTKSLTRNIEGDQGWIYDTVFNAVINNPSLRDIHADEIICLENLEPLEKHIAHCDQDEAPVKQTTLLEQLSRVDFESIKVLTDYEILATLAVYQHEARIRGLSRFAE